MRSFTNLVWKPFDEVELHCYSMSVLNFLLKNLQGCCLLFNYQGSFSLLSSQRQLIYISIITIACQQLFYFSFSFSLSASIISVVRNSLSRISFLSTFVNKKFHLFFLRSHELLSTFQSCLTRQLVYSRMPRHSCCEVRVMQLHVILLLRTSASLHSVSVGAKPLSTGQCAPCRRLYQLGDWLPPLHLPSDISFPSRIVNIVFIIYFICTIYTIHFPIWI